MMSATSWLSDLSGLAGWTFVLVVVLCVSVWVTIFRRRERFGGRAAPSSERLSGSVGSSFYSLFSGSSSVERARQTCQVSREAVFFSD